MPTIDSSTIIKGPAIVTHDGGVYYSEADISVSMTSEEVELNSSAYGVVDTVRKNVGATIKLTPLCFDATSLAKLWPYANTLPGTMLCGGTDKPLVIHTLAGTKYTFARAALTKMPQLRCAIDQGLIGEAEWSCCVETGADLDDAESLVAITAAAFADTSFDKSKILRGPYTLAWGSTFDEILTEAGITVDFAMTANAEAVDGMGIVDWSAGAIGATASFIPVGVSHADFLTLQTVQGAGNGIGSRGSARANDLVITAPGFSLTLIGCAVTSGETRFGDARMPGQIQMAAHRSWTTGVRNALWTLGLNAA
jgi:hypothetical protein